VTLLAFSLLIQAVIRVLAAGTRDAMERRPPGPVERMGGRGTMSGGSRWYSRGGRYLGNWEEDNK
jgi:hypothetical protein